MWSGFQNKEEGFTGLEAAIVMIAFIVLAAVFSYVMIGSGFSTTQKSQEVVYSGVTQASSSLALSGDVFVGSNATSSANSITFYVTNTAGGTPVDLNKTIITYTDNVKSSTFPYIATNGLWTYTPVLKVNGDSSNNLIEEGDVYKIILMLDGYKEVSSIRSYAFATKWGSQGFGDGQLSLSYGIAVDSSGDVYVTEYNTHRTQKFDSNGTFITKWGSFGSGDGQFNWSWGVTADSSDNIYVSDVWDDRIQKFDSNGTFITKWGSFGTGDGQFDGPQGIEADSSGNIYVADAFNDRIQKFDINGTFINKWGSYGSGNGQFITPCDVAIDSSGNIYVADEGNNRIQKFDSNGTFITKWGCSGWGSFGSGDGQFHNPLSIAVDSSGNVYVADQGNNRIQKFDSIGTFITKWGSFGSGDGQFDFPSSVAIDSSSNIYVVDGNNHRIQKFNLTESVLTKQIFPEANEKIRIEVKPSEGAVLAFTRTMPPSISAGNNYPVY